nr:reverse transcriptase domain-containing protein [Tanacetum cinerariifolium]
MSTRSSARNLFPPLDNPELTLRIRSRSDPPLLNNSDMAAEGNGDLPVPDLQTMEELCQPSLNGRGVNGVTDDALHLYLFPHSLTHHATAWFDCLLRNSINTFEQTAKMFIGKYFPPSMVTKLRNEITNFRQRPDESLFEACERYKLSIDRCSNHNMLPVTQIGTFYNGLTLRHRDTINAAARGTFMKRCPEECYDLIENMTAHQNDWDTSAQRSESSSSITSSSDMKIAALKAEMADINKNLMRVLQVDQQVKVVTPNCEPYGGPHSFSNFPATVGQTQNLYDAGAYQPQGNRNLLRYHSDNYLRPPGPTIPITSSSTVVERETEATKDMVHPTNNGSTKDVQPPIVPIESSILNSKPVNSPIIEPVASPVSAPRPKQKPPIPYSSRLQDQKLHDKANDQREKFFQIFKDLNFNISFADALILIPKFGPSIKSLLTNKDKLCELARTLLNEHFSAVLLKKFPEKLGDPDKFLIPYDFPRMAECLALADLGANINLMPLPAWNKLFFPDLSPTSMTLKLADRSISHPVGIPEDVFVKVGTFHFPADFVVVDFDADPRVPLILGRSFLKTESALIDVFEGELTLHVGKEAITFNLDQTSRYSANYNDMTANRIDVIDMACEDDFLLEEVDAFLAIEDDPTSPEVDQSYLNSEGDILLLEAFLNDDPSLPLPIKEIICLKFVELKYLPPYLEYPFLEGNDKLPVIIVKDLSVEEKTGLITVLKSHKRAIAWKLSDIKGIDPEFCTHKILMEEYFEPALNEATSKDHFALPFMDQMLERLAGNQHYCFLDGFSRYFQIHIDPKDQEKTTFTCPYRTFAYPCITFGLCNAPGTFQRCMMAIFHDMIEKTMEVFMDDFSVFENSFQTCLSHLEKMLKRKGNVSCGVCLRKISVLSHHEQKHCVYGPFRPQISLAKKDSKTRNPHQNVLDPKEINESFPLETLNLVTTHGNSSTLWFADFANYHAGNFVVKGMSSQQKSVYTARKPLTFSRLATMDPPGDTMAQITQPRRGNKYILVAIDYLLKWVEAKALPTDDARVVCKFFRNLFARFGTPRAIISDRDKLDEALRAFRIAYKTPIGCTPHKLVYGKACHLPIELEHKAYWALKHANFDLQTAGDHRKVQLNKLNELRDQAYENSLIYKEKTKRLHDSKIKDRVFNIGDKVLLFNSRLKIFSGKLKSCWFGPFTISHVFPYGTVELSQPDGPNFKVNGHRLKHYFGEDVPKMVVSDLRTFPKDH